MAAHSWTKDKADKRINARLGEVKVIEIKEYVRDTDLNNLPLATAYRVNGVHVYVEMSSII